MQRVSIVGNIGAGKSTLGLALARAIGAPFVELDALRHRGPSNLQDAEFASRVEEIVETRRWVIDGNYQRLLEGVVWPRADTVVWLDLSRPRLMRRLTWRTSLRKVRREVLWGGTVERSRSILARAWAQHDVYRARYGSAMTSGNWSVAFHRVSNRTDAALLLAAARQVSAADNDRRLGRESLSVWDRSADGQ